MRTVIRLEEGGISSTYEADRDFKCPRCGEDLDIKVEEVPQDSPLYKNGIRFMIDCRQCWYFGSPDMKFVER